ncbi:DUF6215 domain-containing protein [Kitasatospora phosalacinea]|uniref:DUF6215 domain-containing protein n=1 Tax=Kitasatospora phosalacinea TaxID=2065 RepID=UPI003CC91F3E
MPRIVGEGVGVPPTPVVGNPGAGSNRSAASCGLRTGADHAGLRGGCRPDDRGACCGGAGRPGGGAFWHSARGSDHRADGQRAEGGEPAACWPIEQDWPAGYPAMCAALNRPDLAELLDVPGERVVSAGVGPYWPRDTAAARVQVGQVVASVSESPTVPYDRLLDASGAATPERGRQRRLPPTVPVAARRRFRGQRAAARPGREADVRPGRLERAPAPDPVRAVLGRPLNRRRRGPTVGRWPGSGRSG